MSDLILTSAQKQFLYNLVTDRLAHVGIETVPVQQVFGFSSISPWLVSKYLMINGQPYDVSVTTSTVEQHGTTEPNWLGVKRKPTKLGELYVMIGTSATYLSPPSEEMTNWIGWDLDKPVSLSDLPKVFQKACDYCQIHWEMMEEMKQVALARPGLKWAGDVPNTQPRTVQTVETEFPTPDQSRIYPLAAKWTMMEELTFYSNEYSSDDE